MAALLLRGGKNGALTLNGDDDVRYRRWERSRRCGWRQVLDVSAEEGCVVVRIDGTAMIATPALAGLLLMAACSTPTAPEWPAGAIPFDPPPVYAQWWKSMEQCSGRSGSFGRVQWYVIEGSSFNGNQVGLWWQAGHRIALAGWHVETQRVVQHEMLHDLLAVPGHGSTFADCDVIL